jgi:hypothetical protein
MGVEYSVEVRCVQAQQKEGLDGGNRGLPRASGLEQSYLAEQLPWP